MRIFVNQLYDPAYISSGGEPDQRSDLLAIRFASFNPILDPWVYILCRRNLLVKGCERLKRTVGQVKEGHGHNNGFVEGQHSPPSFERSNDTSSASLRTTNYRNDVENQVPARTKSFTDFTMRQAWDYDTARASFHLFSVEQTAVLGFEAEIAPVSKTTQATASPKGRSDAQTATSDPLLHTTHVSRVDIVTCTFSTPSSCQSEKCL